MKEIAITFIISEDEYDEIVQRYRERLADMGGTFWSRETYEKAVGVMRRNEDNIVELSNGKQLFLNKEDVVAGAILTKSYERVKKGLDRPQLFKGLERLCRMLGIDFDIIDFGNKEDEPPADIDKGEE